LAPAHLFRVFRYVVNVAKAAKVDNDQRLIYISVRRSPFEPVGFSSPIIIRILQAPGANPKSLFFYPRSKGLTEQALVEIGYKDAIMFRPAVLSNTNRPDAQFAETAVQCVPLPFSFPSYFPHCLSSIPGALRR